MTNFWGKKLVIFHNIKKKKDTFFNKKAFQEYVEIEL